MDICSWNKLRAVAAGPEPGAKVGDWMTRTPETIEPDDTTAHAAVLMDHGGFRHLPVVEGPRVVGMLSIRDILRSALPPPRDHEHGQ